MKKAISLLLALSLLFSLFVVASPISTAAEGSSAAPVFQDVKETDWFYEYVTLAAEKGLVNGVNATTFAPNNNITRGQFATILYRQLGSPDVKDIPNPFTDLVADWYKNAVIYMASIGVINGLTKTTFGPDKNITREQMVTMLYRLKNDTDTTYENATANFADGKDVSSWALDAMNWSIAEGIISGTNKGLLLPQGNATRAQAAKVICLNFNLNRTEYENVTITFWQAGGENQTSQNCMRLLLDKFELLYPGITVEYKAIPWSQDPHTQFQVAIAGGDCADLLLMASPLDFILAGEGELLPLNDLLSQSVLNDLPDMLKSQSTYYGSENKKMYGQIMSVPFYNSPRALMYNKDIFDYFGVEYPTESMSHAELLETAKKVTGKMNDIQVYGYGTRATTSEQYLNFVWNYGGQIVDPYTMTAATDSEAWTKGISDYVALYEAGVVCPGSATLSGTDLFTMFYCGEVAMFVGAVDYAVEMQYSGWNVGIAPLVGETYATCYTGSDVLTIPATTDHPRETALLLNYLMGTEAQAVYAQVTGCFPSVKSAREDPYFADDPILAGFAETVDGAHFFDNFGVFGIGTILKEELAALLQGKCTIEEYQAAITSRINENIREMYY